MKVLIIGAGNQGTGIAGLLAAEHDVEEIILADQSLEITEKAKSKILSIGESSVVGNIRCVEVNAGDVDSIVSIAQGVDVIFNGTIPRFNLPIMKACLEVNAHYLDLYSLPVAGEGSPYGETIDAQFELHEEFKKKNLIAVPCVGADPGMSTMVALHLIKEFDSVEQLDVRWIDYMQTPYFVSTIYPSVFFSHWIGTPGPLYYENGEIKSIALLESEEEFEFPAPIGKRTVYSEAESANLVLVPRFADKEVGTIYSKSASIVAERPLKDVWINAMSDLMKTKQSSDNLVEDLASLLPTFKDLPEDVDPDSFITGGAFALNVKVTGQKDNLTQNKTISILTDYETSVKHLPWSFPGVYNTIGTVPIELVLMMGRGEIEEKGVISVAKLDAEELMKRISARGHHILENTEEN